MDKIVLIRTDNITKTYKDNGVPVKALSGISIEIQKGEFTAIVGPSGSGKTTLLNIISGLDSPTSGSAYLAGTNISEMKGSKLSEFRRDHLGFIFQSYNLIPVLSVEENVEFIMLLQGVSKEKRKENVTEILKAVGLSDMRDRLATKLSGGQQQRVAVARAMVSKPSMILADEPTANLDSKTGGELLDMMKSLNEKTGMTFIFSTHDPMVMERAKRIIEIKDGEVFSDKIRD